MKMHRRFRHAGRTGGEAEQCHVVAAGLYGLVFHRLVQGGAIELGVMIGGAIEADDLREKIAFLGGGDQFVHQAGIAKRQRNFGLVDDLGEFTGPQHRHRVDDDGAGLGGGQPARDHGRVVGRADQDTVTGFYAVILRQRPGDAVRPVRQFLVSAATAIADQRSVIAETALDHAVGQLDACIHPFRVFEAIECNFRPFLEGRKIVAGKRILMA